MGNAGLEEALLRVELAANVQWRVKAYDCGVWLSRTRPTWDSDDFWETMERYYPWLKTHEPRALGALVRAWKKNEVIAVTPAGRVKSRLQKRHNRPIDVYRSLLKES